MKRPKNIYLIDGNSYIYRAYHAIKSLTNSKGFSTNAIYGFTNMLLKILKEKTPDSIVVAFDSPVPTERHRIYEQYKAQRPETPDDLVVQIPYIYKIVDALKIKIYEIPGYEADDVLATLAIKAASQGTDAYIVTGDKDMLQVLDGYIMIYDPMKNLVISKSDVVKKFGVLPDRIPEIMALTGDTIDNIPGVKGIGEKTASEILKDSSLRDILERPELIKKERIRKLVIENRENILMSLSLAKVDADIPVDFEISDCRLQEPDNQELLNIFRDLEFGSLAKMIPVGKVEGRNELITDLKRLQELLRGVSDFLYIDMRSLTESALDTELVNIAFSNEKDIGYYVPFGHRYIGAPEQLEIKSVIELFRPILEKGTVKIIGHNLKKDILKLRRFGIDVKGELRDVMIASYLLNPSRQNHGLYESTLEYLSLRKKTLNELLGKRASYSEVALEEATEYAAFDTSIVLKLEEVLFRKLRDEGLYDIYFEIEMPLIKVLTEMEEAGIKVDNSVLREISIELGRELSLLQSRIYSLAGGEFNINSPKQLSQILFHSIGLKPIKKTKTGYSTEVGVLEELAREHKLPREILNWRTLSKLKNTYVDVLPGLINAKTGRIHTTFNQAVTATGRLSSSDPNLQNIPIKGEWGKRMRQAFISEEGYLLLSADYSQIELRLLAHLSGDRGLIEAFNNDVDIHRKTVMDLFGLSEEDVTPEMRRVAKTVNFGIIYGISPFGLSEAIGSSKEDARLYIEQYFEKHPGVKNYVESIIQEARDLGYVQTLFGRKRRIPELKSPNSKQRALGERLAMNTPIQGTAADVIKKAMININKRLHENGLQSKILLQVHDELVFEVKEDEIERVSKLVRYEMENATTLAVPIKVEISYGKNWAEAHG